MKKELELHNLLEEVVAIANDPGGKFYGAGLWKKCHKLVEAHYLPAKDFFIQELDDPRWNWRRESVSLLGYHYKLDQKVINKIQGLLLHDPDSGVRIACASVLGNQSKLPDIALLEALEHDANALVKESAFTAILDLAGVPFKIREYYLQKLRVGDLSPTVDQIKEILVIENINTNDIFDK
ncbi:protein containg HEAT repeats [Longilinea arvoryzae]|uniref:Protein containg HEAT repeats n=1 Tax=Longilinea arvoryzae TaxID=360412 RepID=A0A0K8MXX0_9CHLR|nr:HEAT repeat domain-containing protein [Longilinea arvoryzae]GAP16104.1 protein containg HEAT repeats [Longilinea arvoryzae]